MPGILITDKQTIILLTKYSPCKLKWTDGCCQKYYLPVYWSMIIRAIPFKREGGGSAEISLAPPSPGI